MGLWNKAKEKKILEVGIRETKQHGEQNCQNKTGKNSKHRTTTIMPFSIEHLKKALTNCPILLYLCFAQFPHFVGTVVRKCYSSRILLGAPFTTWFRPLRGRVAALTYKPAVKKQRNVSAASSLLHREKTSHHLTLMFQVSNCLSVFLPSCSPISSTSVGLYPNIYLNYISIEKRCFNIDRFMTYLDNL